MQPYSKLKSVKYGTTIDQLEELCNVVLAFKSLIVILRFDDSNESFSVFCLQYLIVNAPKIEPVVSDHSKCEVKVVADELSRGKTTGAFNFESHQR